MTPNQNSIIINKNLTIILDYFEKEENIEHKTIALYSNITYKDFESTLKELQNKITKITITYIQIEDKQEDICLLSNHELSIVILKTDIQPLQILSKYSFQSHLKNIFGTLNTTIITEQQLIVTKKQIHITSIGK